MSAGAEGVDWLKGALEDRRNVRVPFVDRPSRRNLPKTRQFVLRIVNRGRLGLDGSAPHCMLRGHGAAKCKFWYARCYLASHDDAPHLSACREWQSRKHDDKMCGKKPHDK